MSVIQKKLVVAVAAVIFASLLLEVGARFFAYIDQPLLSGNQLFEEKYFVMRHLDYSKKPTIFLMGDSTMNRGVYPDLLSALLEKKGVHVQIANLAFDGGKPLSSIKLLEAAQNLNIKPSLVIYDFTGGVEFDNSGTKQKTFEADDDLKKINESYMGRCLLCKRKKTIGGLLCWLEDNSMFIRNRSYLKQRFLDFVKTQANARLYEWTVVKPFSDHDMVVSNMGWNPNHFIMSKEDLAINLERSRLKAKTDKNVAPLRNGSYHVDFTLHEPMRNYCANHQIKLVMVFLPLYAPYKVPESFSLLTSGAITRDWADDQFEKTSEPDKNFYAIAIKGLNYDMAYFSDPYHINTYGAVETTKKLADVLSQAPYRTMFKNFDHTEISSSQP